MIKLRIESIMSSAMANNKEQRHTHESLKNLTPEEYPLMAEKPEISKSAWN